MIVSGFEMNITDNFRSYSAKLISTKKRVNAFNNHKKDEIKFTWEIPCISSVTVSDTLSLRYIYVSLGSKLSVADKIISNVIEIKLQGIHKATVDYLVLFDSIRIYSIYIKVSYTP